MNKPTRRELFGWAGTGLALSMLPGTLRRAEAAPPEAPAGGKGMPGGPSHLVDIDGEAAGYLTAFTAPTYEAMAAQGRASGTSGPQIGEFTARFPLNQTGKLWTVLGAALKKSSTQFNMGVTLAESGRRIDMMGCLATGLSFSTLDRRAKTAHMEATLTGVCDKLDFRVDKHAQAMMLKQGRPWIAADFEPSGMPGGILPASVLTVAPPKLVGKLADGKMGGRRANPASWDVSGLTTEHGAQGFDAVKDLCVKVIQDGAITDEEYTDWGADLKDQTMKTVLATYTFKYTAPKKFTWAPEGSGAGADAIACRVEWAVGDCFLENKHKG